MDLTPYQLELAPAPPAVEQVIAQGVRAGLVPAPNDAARWLLAQPELEHAVIRAADGRLFVTTTTELPGVAPDMVDWWFGWHLPESARYRLWHPQAHVRAVVKEDRSALVGRRECYVGNVSFVDEYIGATLMKLAIAFMPAAELGFDEHTDGSETVVCARTSDRTKPAEVGYLAHRVFAVPGGARMQSLFWLGEIRPRIPVLAAPIAAILNTTALRKLLVPDVIGLALLRHCAEEMNHLAKFLPALHAQYSNPERPPR